MSTRFLFFDLGNVLIRFSTDRLFSQAAAVVGQTPQWIFENLYSAEMLRLAECGHFSAEEFYRYVCELLPGKEIPFEKLLAAVNEIFWLNEPMRPTLTQIAENGLPCGILSNIGPWHWEYCRNTFSEIFQYVPANHVLSYKVGVMKPAREIYSAAFQFAREAVPGIEPGEVLFIDDLEKNVRGAKEFGFDAVQYSFKNHEALLVQLRLRKMTIAEPAA
ncbi:MAG: HAD family phosphatase [Planctomycetaceae bacterium]|nr:HAD family phosphatase [Planctomycetaceae bacterium]